MCNEFSSTKWENELNSMSVDEMYESFLALYDKVCDKCVPTKKNRPVKLKPKWLNPSLKKLCDDKNKSWFKCKHTKFKNKRLVDNYNRLKAQ